MSVIQSLGAEGLQTVNSMKISSYTFRAFLVIRGVDPVGWCIPPANM